MELWSMFRDRDEYFWVDATEASSRKPTCIASFKRRPERVTVFCGKQLTPEINGKRMVNNPFTHPLDQILIMYALAERDGAMLHACAVELDGKGYILPGRSGAGKSTISRIFAARGYNLCKRRPCGHARKDKR